MENFRSGWFLRKKNKRAVKRRKQINPEISRKVFWTLTAVIVFFFFAVILFVPDAGLTRYVQARWELAKIQRGNEDAEQKNIRLREEIQRLKTDEAYLEQVAREKYGLLKKDELLYEIKPGK